MKKIKIYSHLIKKKTKRYLKKAFSFKLVLLLTLLYAFYLFFIADARYKSSAVIAVKSTNAQNTSSLLSLVNATVATSSKEDIMYLKEYILSLDMLRILENKLQLKENILMHKDYRLWFKNFDYDEDFLSYYKSLVSVNYDDLTGLTTISVEAFSPEYAQKLNNLILSESEKFINDISHNIANEEVKFNKEQLEKIQDEFFKAQYNLKAFQDKNNIFDPTNEAQAQGALVATLKSNLSKKQIEINTLKTYLNDNSPQIKNLKSEILALKEQLKLEQDKIASSKNDEKLNDLAFEFENLTFKLKFATDAYKLALTSYEKARIDALKKVKQLIKITNPQIFLKSVYPNYTYDILSLFVILSLIFACIKITNTIIQEHRY
ncbi:capsule biosynthesis protein [Campylobacter canadensis]|uniref:Capsule biosynthesis protein n=1 Tax=Campylobacter canadensis TaxID=449520 RepID=A0ABS7WT05_9BACT|nr:capsule biosynthesis protein [Campylobacter canadensis]MBZ7987911.1 capsule biosynthesis protein [Campylobacter canadensis]MBZ7995387.1 capsule biosynthesis protein [Campylobacter canadensis]MBZ7997068.1 capsule biosynthesis protein [Campylobacter canadensis]MBZ7998884.1 capsule biosynthesis protein [Campylobacter canadensis]MBZ8000563.1 capsule biosynthesis protein [Campylobacter canadensis]